MKIFRFYMMLCLCLFFVTASKAYNIIGKVVTLENPAGIADVYVFINNTQKYAITDSLGNFSLLNVPEKYFDIVVYKKGFEKLIFRYGPEDIGHTIKFELEKVKTDSALIQPDSLIRFNLKRWSAVFMTGFIGDTKNAESEVLNPEVLRFYLDSLHHKLTIRATDQIHIINESLGYLVNICLTEFVQEEKTISFDKQVFYKPLSSKSVELQAKWRENRSGLYKGSLLHFMRSLYKNNLEAEGFILKTVKRIDPAELNIVKNYEVLTQYQPVFINDTTNMTVHYKVMVARQAIKPAELLKVDTDNNLVYFASKDPVQVTYKNGYLPYEYLHSIGYETYALQKQTSFLSTLDSFRIVIQPSGRYLETSNIFVDGFWGWQNVFIRLPFDYEEFLKAE